MVAIMSSSRISPPARQQATTAPFPTRQMLVLAICRISEPIAFMGIFPYVYFMVRDFHITEDKSTISFYAGLITSAFTFAEFSTGWLWGRLSDRVGRKPVLMCGLIGTALSVLIFGFAQNFWIALLARAVGGLLNGNMGVLQTTIAELVPDKSQQPRAYTIMPVVWCLGSVIGPMIGGALARPCDSFPRLFPAESIWGRFPYLLPNLFSACVVCVGVVTGLLFLEETHPEKKKGRDRCLELGHWILSKLPGSGQTRHRLPQREGKPKADRGETSPLLVHDDDQDSLPDYESARSSTDATSGPEIREPAIGSVTLSPVRSPSRMEVPQMFTRAVVVNIISFGILAFHTMTFDSLLPTFLSTAHPESPTPVKLPFKFADGFQYDSNVVGMILAGQGVYSVLLNMLVVPRVIERFGPLRLFRFLAAGYFTLYLFTPYLVLLPERMRMVGICIVLVWKCSFANMAYPCNAILMARLAPSQLALGSINGVAASTASLSRGFGPTLSGMLYTVGLKSGYSGLAWWFSAVIAIAGAFVGFRIPEPTLSEKAAHDVEAGQKKASS